MTEWNLIIYAPAYNVEKSLPEFLRRISTVKKKLERKKIKLHKLLIVNDGSTDRTPKILADFRRKNKFLGLINNSKNEGVVKSLFAGMEKVDKILEKFGSENFLVVRIDTDMEHDPLEIEKLIELVIGEKADMVVGVTDFRGFPFYTRLFNRYVGLEESRKFLNMDVPQFCPGFNVMRAELFRTVNSELKENAREFKRITGRQMLTMDFVSLIIAKKNGSLLAIRLNPIEKKWIRNPPIKKLLDYFDYHKKTTVFLKKKESLNR